MEDLHRNHEGINKAMSLARTCVYWPRMEADVTDYIKRCLMCIESSNLPVDTIQPHEVPSGPWDKVGMGFFPKMTLEKTPDCCRLFWQIPICLSSCIFTSPQNHQLSLRTLHHRRCSCHCDVQQWPSIQWRQLQEICKRIQLHSYNFITSFPPVKWFHQGNGEES